MLCEHLRPLEQAIITAGIRETFRGRPWSMNCREWVYFDCYIDTDSVLKAFSFLDCVSVHAHRGTHDGQEKGFVCSRCQDAIMGAYEPTPRMKVFKG